MPWLWVLGALYKCVILSLLIGNFSISFSLILHYLSVSGEQWISSRQWLKPAKSPFKPLDGRRRECTDQPRSLEQKIAAEGHCGMQTSRFPLSTALSTTLSTNSVSTRNTLVPSSCVCLWEGVGSYLVLTLNLWEGPYFITILNLWGPLMFPLISVFLERGSYFYPALH